MLHVRTCLFRAKSNTELGELTAVGVTCHCVDLSNTVPDIGYAHGTHSVEQSWHSNRYSERQCAADAGMETQWQ